MRGLTLPFAPMKTYGPISIDLREKRRKEIFFFSLFLHAFFLPLLSVLSKMTFYFFFFDFFLSMCPSLIRVRFCPETIFLFPVQFILNELSSSYFLTFEIFVKFSSLESLTTYHPETRKNFRLSQNLTKFFWVTRFRETNLTAQSVLSFEI